MTEARLKFNPPPGWPQPPADWAPPKGWTPDPAWPPLPKGWPLWIPVESASQGAADPSVSTAAAPAPDPALRSQAEIPVALMTPQKRIALLEAENAALRAQLESIGADAEAVIDLNDERVLQNVGIYRYHHPLEHTVAYRERLEGITAKIAELVKAGQAIEMSNRFTFDGSLAKGRTMSNDLARLMLRAYNAEAENVVRALRAGNSSTAIKRLDNARNTIAKLGKMMEMHISDAYHALRLQEIELTADYLMKKEEEKEAAREERERLREERKVEMELAAAREKLNKERTHLVNVIDKLSASGKSDPELQNKLAEVDNAIAQNDYRAANIRAGYVYVISNRGAFGKHVVKIGLTRRLDPLDRIHELGDASVPFRFDIHAIYFSEDAVRLENELHEHFAQYRVNWINNRREFFFASPSEVRTVLSAKVGNLLEFVDNVDSTEYLQSIGYWPQHLRPEDLTSPISN